MRFATCQLTPAKLCRLRKKKKPTFFCAPASGTLKRTSKRTATWTLEHVYATPNCERKMKNQSEKKTNKQTNKLRVRRNAMIIRWRWQTIEITKKRNEITPIDHRNDSMWKRRWLNNLLVVSAITCLWVTRTNVCIYIYIYIIIIKMKNKKNYTCTLVCEKHTRV